MRDPSRQTNWLGKFPDWLKALVGLFGTIGAIAAFVVAFQKSFALYVTITAVLLLAYLFLLSLYIFLARSKSRSKKTPPGYRFGRYRFFGLFGMLIVLLVSGIGSSLSVVRQTLTSAVFGTPLPTSTQTLAPTSTLAPTPTLVPTQTLTPLPELAAPDVWIAKFNAPGSAQSLAAEYRIEEALRQKLEQFQGQKVTVRIADDPITSDDEAQQVINNSQSKVKVVIWGWYNESGAAVQMLLSGGEKPGTPIPVTGVIDLLSVPPQDRPRKLELTVSQNLPQNVTFMSLFIIGHLAYLSNNYQAGHEAFDAAMQGIPDDAVIANKAILDFFQARSRQKQDSPDLQGAACGYARAIQEDLQSNQGSAAQVADVAYNNLGMVISLYYQSRKSIPALPTTPIPDATIACLQGLQQAGLLGVDEDIQDPKVYFQHAVDLNPNLTFATYNKTVFEWLQSSGGNVTEAKAQIEPQMKAYIAQNPSLIGPYMLLASLDDDAKNYQEAEQMYLDGIKQNPNISLMHFNLGQLYLSHDQNNEAAIHEFKETLRLDSNHPQAHLALANVYYRQDQIDEAGSEMDAALARLSMPGTDLDLRRAAWLLRSAIAFKQNDVTGAEEYVSKVIEERPNYPFPYFLLGLLHQQDGRVDQAVNDLNKLKELDPLDFSPQSNYMMDYSLIGVLWNGFRYRCLNNDEIPTMPFPDWVMNRFPSSTCLGADLSDPKARLVAVYDLVSDQLLGQRDPALFELLGGQCPFVYTDDPITGAWNLQTTILYKVVDHEAAQFRPLQQFNGRLLIREEEHEISHINRLYVIAKMSDGSTQILMPNLDALQRADNDYLILHQGDEAVLSFDNYPVTGKVSEWWVMAVGYYTPL